MNTTLQLEHHTFKARNHTWIFEAKQPSPFGATVPHDPGISSADLIGVFEERKIGHKGRDKYVWPTVNGILHHSKTGSAFRGMLHRSVVDYNRSPVGINYYPLTQTEVHTAYDDPRCAPFYDFYHGQVAKKIKELIKIFGAENILFCDFHGFSRQPPHGPYDIILGTGNRKTIKTDVDVEFAEHLSQKGYSVFLPRETTVGREEDWYAADFTTRHYAERYGINFIQVEIFSDLRQYANRHLGEQLSMHIADFVSGYCQRIKKSL
jgi:N-formylglutamate amidohydrolase